MDITIKMTRLSALNFLYKDHSKAKLLAAALLSLAVISPGQAIQIEVAGDQLILSGPVVTAISIRSRAA
jgi:hypothetical protein